ncbi:MAG: hypothetical protein M3Q71_20895, partial [Chloroflexota bacterium]|nr:hypothetical protein [Chloroflexota bacterium]
MTSTDAVNRRLPASLGRQTRTSPRSLGGRPTSLVRPLLGLPILYKVLLANAGIVVIGAVAGTWITLRMAERIPEQNHGLLVPIFVVAGIILSVLVNFLVLRAAFRPLSNLERAATAVRSGDLSVRAEQSA